MSSRIYGRIGGLTAAIALTAFFAAAPARADTFSVVCNAIDCSSYNLPGTAGGTTGFNPGGWPAGGIDGLNPGASVSVISSPVLTTSGLFMDPGTMSVKFTYLGYEASNLNVSDADFVLGGLHLFTSGTTVVGKTVTINYSLGAGSHLLPFSFTDKSVNPNPHAANGGPTTGGSSIAYYVASLTTVYILFDDGQAHGFGEPDFDDMVVKAEILTGFAPVPLPAALPLFATGLGALGIVGLRRKRKAARA